MKAWISTPENILGLLIVGIFTALMVTYGHDVLGSFDVTEKLKIPVAALPIVFGFFIMKTNLTANIQAIRGDKAPPAPPAQ